MPEKVKPGFVRFGAVDVLKGIGIIFVVMGHTSSALIGGTLIFYLYSFHIPLFFWVSGYLTYGSRTTSFKELLVKRTKSIMLPYLCFAVLLLIFAYIVDPVIQGTAPIIPSFREIIKTLLIWNGDSVNNFNFTLWFLPLLFVTTLVFHFLKKLKTRILIITLLLLAIVAPVLQIILPGRPIIHINGLPVALVFAGIGFLFHKYETPINARQWRFATLLLFCGGAGFFLFNQGANLARIQNPLFFFCGATCSIIFFYRVAGTLSSKTLEYLGRNSLIVYGIHTIAITLYFASSVALFFAAKLNGALLYIINLGIIIGVTLLVVGAKDLVRRTIWPAPAPQKAAAKRSQG